MTDIPSVYLIDDETSAIELFTTLKKIDGFQEAISMSLQDAFQTEGKTVDEVAVPCVKKIESSDSLQCVVFLDLQLKLREKIEADVRTRLRDVLHIEQAYAHNAPDFYQGYAVANRIIELLPKNFLKRLLFMIQTRGEYAPIPKVSNQRILFGLVPSLLVSFGRFGGDRINTLNVVGKMPWEAIKSEKKVRPVISFRDVKGFFEGTDSARWWLSRWLLHEDPYVANILTDYFEPFRANVKEAWTHNWAASDEGLAAGEKIIGVRPDTESNKALFMRLSKEMAFHGEPVSSDLHPDLLKRILERLDIMAEMVGMEDGFFKLPAMPGVAFLVALKILLNELAKEAPAERVEFRTDGTSYGVRVLLGEREQKEGNVSQRGYHCVRRFIDKLHSEGAGQPPDGVSGAVYDTGHCRLRGLQNEDCPWATMLEEGLSHWAAWPSFIEDGIEFRW